jgi:glutamyl-tRNA reductase
LLIALGISHKTASFAVRQKVAFAQENIQPALADFLRVSQATQAAILSTCNRTEFYCSQVTADKIIHWWKTYLNLDSEALEPYLYCHMNTNAVRHIMEVACGLDSMILGESQIFGQLKSAFEMANAIGALGKELTKLFQTAFFVAKEIRTQTAIGQHPVSIAYAATHLAKKLFSDLTEAQVLLIGAGETIELVALHLCQLGIQHLKVANRSFEGAQKLVERFGGEALLLEEIADHLSNVDIVISSTASPSPIITVDLLKTALKAGIKQPIFMLDLAVPCDIDPSVAQFPDVHLYTIDDLQSLVEMNKLARQQAALDAQGRLDRQVKQYIDWLESHQAVCVFREKINRIKIEELNKAMNLLSRGEHPEEVLQYLAHNLTQKLMHEPTLRLKNEMLTQEN